MKQSANNHRSIALTVAVSIIALLFSTTACDVVNIDGQKGKGTINIHLSEASSPSSGMLTASSTTGDSEAKPEIGNLEEVNIDLQELRILFFANPSDSASVDTTENEFDEGQGEWVTLDITPRKLNLLDISNSDTLLAEAELEDGFYSEIRLILGDDNDVVVDGETHSLKVPSGRQSGYKLKVSEPLESGEIVNLTIEFDAEKSVKKTGNGQYILQPVLNIHKGTDDGEEEEDDETDEEEDEEDDEEEESDE